MIECPRRLHLLHAWLNQRHTHLLSDDPRVPGTWLRAVRSIATDPRVMQEILNAFQKKPSCKTIVLTAQSPLGTEAVQEAAQELQQCGFLSEVRVADANRNLVHWRISKRGREYFRYRFLETWAIHVVSNLLQGDPSATGHRNVIIRTRACERISIPVLALAAENAMAILPLLCCWGREAAMDRLRMFAGAGECLALGAEQNVVLAVSRPRAEGLLREAGLERACRICLWDELADHIGRVLRGPDSSRADDIVSPDQAGPDLPPVKAAPAVMGIGQGVSLGGAESAAVQEVAVVDRRTRAGAQAGGPGDGSCEPPRGRLETWLRQRDLRYVRHRDVATVPLPLLEAARFMGEHYADLPRFSVRKRRASARGPGWSRVLARIADERQLEIIRSVGKIVEPLSREARVRTDGATTRFELRFGGEYAYYRFFCGEWLELYGYLVMRDIIEQFDADAELYWGFVVGTQRRIPPFELDVFAFFGGGAVLLEAKVGKYRPRKARLLARRLGLPPECAIVVTGRPRGRLMDRQRVTKCRAERLRGCVVEAVRTASQDGFVRC